MHRRDKWSLGLMFSVCCLVAYEGYATVYNLFRTAAPKSETLSRPENPTFFFPKDWHSEVVKPGQASLLSNANSPCALLSYGWKVYPAIGSTRHLGDQESPNFQKNEWAYQANLRSTAPKLAQMRVTLKLVTKDKAVLSTRTLTTDRLLDENESRDSRVGYTSLAGSTGLEDKGLGEPSGLDIDVECESK